jgi:hypothetical protein
LSIWHVVPHKIQLVVIHTISSCRNRSTHTKVKTIIDPTNYLLHSIVNSFRLKRGNTRKQESKK